MEFPNRVIKQNEKDAGIVRAIQNHLNELGLGPISLNDNYGPKTIAAVKLFQSTHRDQNGNPLEIDGKVGSITWAALFGLENVFTSNETGNELSKEAIKVAQSQVGVMEKPAGSNKGPEVNRYLASVDCPPGNFWCASFIYWCFDQATKELNKKTLFLKRLAVSVTGTTQKERKYWQKMHLIILLY